MQKTCIFFVVALVSCAAFRFPICRIDKLHTRKYQVAFAQQVTALANAKEVLLSSEHTSMTKQELNEYILQLEKLNPTEDPALSPLLNGIWEIIASGYFTPGMLGVQALKASPLTMFGKTILSCNGPVITISNSSPRVSVATTVKVGNAAIPFSVATELEVESGVRVKEVYVKGTVGGMEVPLSKLHPFSREVLISYLDADLLIARNSMGEPEVLRRQAYVAAQAVGVPSATDEHGAPGV